MRYVLAVLMMLVAMVSTAPRVDALELPEDVAQWHTSLFVRDRGITNPTDRATWEAFWHDPQLRSLREQTAWHVYSPADSIYASRFSRHVRNEFPCVMVQRGDGEVIYKASGRSVVANSMGSEIAGSIQRWECDRGRCRPVPEPDPEPEVRREERAERREEPVPDVRPQSPGWGVVAAVAVAASLGGFALSWSQSKRR